MLSRQNPVLVLASRNQHKVRELAALLAGLGWRIASLADFPDAVDVDETGETFAENAELKAIAAAAATGYWALADDSGLAVDVLEGSPGVRSARYAGPSATDAQNNAHLLARLRDVPDPLRGARFVCCLALADPTGRVRVRVEAHCRGRLLHEPRGHNGFGYDPLFWIAEYHQTFGELLPAVKNAISHRARALERLRAELAWLTDEMEIPAVRG